METKSIAHRVLGPLSIEVHGTRAPTDDEWEEFLKAAAKATAQGSSRVLIVTAGWGPNAKQRARAREVIGEVPITVAVVSDDPLVRGVVTAFSWFHPRMRAFAFNEGAGLREALKYLQVDDALAARAASEVRVMQRELGEGGSR